MSEIPEDIMIAARAVADAVCPALPVDEQAAFVAAKWPIVARAIMAERARCLRIVEVRCEGDMDFAAHLIKRET